MFISQGICYSWLADNVIKHNISRETYSQKTNKLLKKRLFYKNGISYIRFEQTTPTTFYNSPGSWKVCCIFGISISILWMRPGLAPKGANKAKKEMCDPGWGRHHIHHVSKELFILATPALPTQQRFFLIRAPQYCWHVQFLTQVEYSNIKNIRNRNIRLTHPHNNQISCRHQIKVSIVHFQKYTFMTNALLAINHSINLKDKEQLRQADKLS